MTGARSVDPVHAAVLRQAERTPDTPAIVSDSGVLTYAELAATAAGVAAALGPHLTPGATVALLSRRDAPALAGLLGVFLAGGVYLPLDPAAPAERIRRLLAQTGTTTALVGADVDPSLLPASVTPVPLVVPPAAAAPPTDAGADQPAYIIYTSGSTGVPKGVRGTHGGLANLATALRRLYGFGRGDRVLQFSSLSWDTSLEEMLPVWTAGATLVLHPTTTPTLHSFLELCADQAITAVNLPTAFWVELARHDTALPACVRTVTVGGEAVPLAAVARWVERYGRTVRLVNTYGLTEATAVSTAVDLQELDLEPGARHAPIGRPIDGVGVRVVDAALAEVAPGEPGELLILGAGVAAGYVRPGAAGDAGLDAPTDAGRFVRDPVSGEPAVRTGDLVRLDADGLLHYLGRADSQVKVRGYRIEPAEIEAALLEHPQVRQAAVVAVPHRYSQALVAFISFLSGRTEPTVDALRSWLVDRLPTHLRPQRIIAWPQLPTLPSGKVDRVALTEAASTPATPAVPRSDRLTASSSDLLAIVTDVLGTDATAADNFLAIGGDSISAMVVAARLRAAGFGTTAEAVLTAATLDALESGLTPAAPPAPPEAGSAAPPAAASGRHLPLTPMQRGILFETLLSGETQVYFDQDLWEVTGPLDPARFEESWRWVIARHDALRASFEWHDTEPRQVIHDIVDVGVSLLDWSARTPGEQRAGLAELLRDDLATHFDLARPPALRFTLVRLEPSRHWFVWSAHRLVLDGWSTTVLLDEFIEVYDAAAAGREPVLPPPFPYTRYVTAQSEPPAPATLAFWRSYLDGVTAPTPLPGAVAGPHRGAHRATQHDHVVASVPTPLTLGLQQLTRDLRITSSAVWRCAWGLLLSRYAGESDVVFGATSAGRPETLPGVTQAVGLFINSLPVRVRIDDSQTAAELLGQVHAMATAAAAHDRAPLGTVQELSAVRGRPLFESLLIVQNYPGAATYSRVGTIQMRHQQGFEQVHYPLSLVVRHIADDELRAELWYERGVIDAQLAAWLAEHLMVIVAGLLDRPHAPVGDLPALGAEERRTLDGWSHGPPVPVPESVLVPLANMVTRQPGHLAVLDRGQGTSYGELWQDAQRIAAGLRQAGARPADLVGIHQERSASTLASILGTLLAGCAYLGLDVQTPPQRRQEILAQARPALIIGDGLPGARATGTLEAPALPLPAPGRADLAYAVFTSGSTGPPKGVLVEHGGLASYASAAIVKYRLTPQDRVLWGASLNVDWTASELFPALAGGASLVVRDPDTFDDVRSLLDFCARTEVTILILPTALWHQLVRELGQGVRLPPSLRVVDIGGERAIPAVVRRWRELVGDTVVLCNGYGPSEATIEATSCRLAGGPGAPAGGWHEVPIGRPLANVTARVLDRTGRLAPVGAIGELYLGGAGVARGYLGDAGLTAQRFGPDPLGGGRLYRTGDLVRWLTDGQLEYWGRGDRQVKVRGQRIELGEVESVLLAHAAVREALVVPLVGAENEVDGLTAYVVAADGPVVVGELRAHAATRLPPASVPVRWIAVPYFPVGLGGKVDLAALPDPRGPAAVSAATKSLPEPGTVAGHAVGICAELLGGHLDQALNFFDAGGNSLVAMRLVARLRHEVGLELPLRTLFEFQTLADFCAWAREHGPEGRLPQEVGA